MIRKSLALLAIAWLGAGCNATTNVPPKNANAVEMAALSKLLPAAENVTWNTSGRVTALDLSGVSLDREATSRLKALKELRELNLSGTKIDKKAIKDLASLTSLRALSLAWTPTDDSSLEDIVALEELRTLDLSHTQITDASFEQLSSLHNLDHLFLTGTSISPPVIDTLKRQLANCRVQK